MQEEMPTVPGGESLSEKMVTALFIGWLVSSKWSLSISRGYLVTVFKKEARATELV